MTRLFFVAVLGLLMASPALAQRSIGIGGQVGDPTGVTVRIGSTGMAIDIAAGWNLSTNRIFAQAHYIPGQIGLGVRPAAVRLFYGPGGFIGAGGSGNQDATFGVSFNTGLSLWTGPLEFFGQITPRLQLVESTDFQLGGGVGLRYYF
jgi:hypothetical protein